MPLFRYPGGKTKLKGQILAKLNQLNTGGIEYREVFVGGGGIGMEIMKMDSSLKGVWINDKDPGIAALWSAVIHHPEQLKEQVRGFTPQLSAYDAFKADLQACDTMPSDPAQVVDLGFKKLALHQMSFSGLGTKSGGPLGGRMQDRYTIDCRWSASRICMGIDQAHVALGRVPTLCTNSDFAELIEDESTPSLLYLDPPYYVMGNDLYQCGFSVADHERLAGLLKNTKHKWVLSYDDCPEIRTLYSWARIEVISASYSIAGATKKAELLITTPN